MFGGSEAIANLGLDIPAKLDPLHRLRGWRMLGDAVAAELGIVHVHPHHRVGALLRRDVLERRHRRVLTDREAARQTFRQPIRGHKGRFAQKIVLFQRASAEIDRAVGWLQTSE